MRILVCMMALLFCGQGCVARSARPVLGSNAVRSITQVPSTNLVVLIQSGRVQEQATISLGDIRGGRNSYTDVLCRNTDGNLEVLLQPSLIYVEGLVKGKEDPHIEYFKGGYIVHLYFGRTDAQKLSPPGKPSYLGLAFIDVSRPREVMQVSTNQLSKGYRILLTAVKKSDQRSTSATVMSCVTRNRS